jgi:hypothetical protein
MIFKFLIINQGWRTVANRCKNCYSPFATVRVRDGFFIAYFYLKKKKKICKKNLCERLLREKILILLKDKRFFKFLIKGERRPTTANGGDQITLKNDNIAIFNFLNTLFLCFFVYVYVLNTIFCCV